MVLSNEQVFNTGKYRGALFHLNFQAYEQAKFQRKMLKFKNENSVLAKNTQPIKNSYKMGRALIEKRLGTKKSDMNLMMSQSVLGSEAGGETIVSRAPSVVNLESLIEGEGEYTDIFDGKKSRLGVEELKSKLNQETGNM